MNLPCDEFTIRWINSPRWIYRRLIYGDKFTGYHIFLVYFQSKGMICNFIGRIWKFSQLRRTLIASHVCNKFFRSIVMKLCCIFFYSESNDIICNFFYENWKKTFKKNFNSLFSFVINFFSFECHEDVLYL